MRLRAFAIALISLLTAGCAITPGPTAWSRCSSLLEQGTIYVGQPIEEFLLLCDPLVTEHFGPFTVYNFNRVPGYAGLTIRAYKGKLVSAADWTDFAPPHIYFNVMSESDMDLLSNLIINE